MQTSTITSKGQVTVPKDIRKSLGLEEGDEVMFIGFENRATIVPLGGHHLDSLYGILKHRKKAPLDLKKARQQYRRKIAQKIMNWEA